MKRIGILLLLGPLWAPWGCAESTPCDGATSACLTVRLQSSTGRGERIDTVDFNVEGDGDLRYGYRWMTAAGGQILPLYAPLPLPEEAQRTLKISASGVWNGRLILAGTRVVSDLDGGEHRSIVLTLSPPGGDGASCDDGVQNGAETGVDCGGSCAPCGPSCTDGIKNGSESDVDCGGSCAPCYGGQACAAPTDCISGRCEVTACVAALGLASLSPSSGPTTGATPITLRGELFAGDLQVRFGATQAAVTSVAPDGRSAVVTLPAGAAGPIDVHLSRGADMSTRSGAFAYYYGSLRFGDTPRPTYGPGNKPYFIVSGQFNKAADQLLDVAVVNEIDSNVVIYLGKGDGTFTQGMTYPVGRIDGCYPLMGSVGDINGDGNPDIVTVDNRDPAVTVLLANGDGTFKPHAEYDVPAGPLDRAWPPALRTADFNGDGMDDVAVGDSMNGARAYVLLAAANHSGTLGAAIYVEGSDNGRRDPDVTLVAGRIDGDTFADLAVASSAAHEARIFLGRGDGTFRAGGTAALGIGSYSLALSDLDRDGKTDLLSANRGSDDVSVVLGSGDGTFRQPRTIKTLSGPYSVALGDLDGDGRLDLATPCYREMRGGDTALALLLGDGAGGFPRTAELQVAPTAFGVTSGDYNGDGKLDLVTSSVAPSNLLTILLNRSM